MISKHASEVFMHVLPGIVLHHCAKAELVRMWTRSRIGMPEEADRNGDGSTLIVRRP